MSSPWLLREEEGSRPNPGAAAPGQTTTSVAHATTPTQSAVPPQVGQVVRNDGARPRQWPRLLLVQGLQVIPLAVAILGQGPGALWCAGVMGSAICCAGTDSLWRWRNRVLVAQAVVWLLVPLLFAAGNPGG